MRRLVPAWCSLGLVALVATTPQAAPARRDVPNAELQDTAKAKQKVPKPPRTPAADSVRLDKRAKDASADVNRLRDLSRCGHELEVILAKQRSGPIGTVNLWADMAANVIRDPSEVAA